MRETTLAKGGGDRHTLLLCGSFPVVSHVGQLCVVEICGILYILKNSTGRDLEKDQITHANNTFQVIPGEYF